MPWRPVSPRLATARLLVLSVFLVPPLLVLRRARRVRLDGFWVGAARRRGRPRLRRLADPPPGPRDHLGRGGRGAGGPPRPDVPHPGQRALRPAAVRRRPVRPAGAAVRHGHRRAAHRLAAERRPDPRAADGRGRGAPRAAGRPGRVAAGRSVSAPSSPRRPDPATQPAPEAEWRHLHPLSPLLKGGIAFVAVLAYVVSQQADSFFGARARRPHPGPPGLGRDRRSWSSCSASSPGRGCRGGSRGSASPTRSSSCGPACSSASTGRCGSTGSRPSTSVGRCWPASPGCRRSWSSPPAARTRTSSCRSSPTPRPSRCASS